MGISWCLRWLSSSRFPSLLMCPILYLAAWKTRSSYLANEVLVARPAAVRLNLTYRPDVSGQTNPPGSFPTSGKGELRMARSLLVGLVLCGLVFVVNSAEAGRFRKGGCSGGSCGVSTGCANGSCSVQAPVQAPSKKLSPSDAPPAPAPAASTEAPAAPAVAVEASAPATTMVATDSTRSSRGRLFNRRAR